MKQCLYASVSLSKGLVSFHFIESTTFSYLEKNSDSQKLKRERGERKRETMKERKKTVLMMQWTRVCLPMQGTRVLSLVQEDPTCHRATKPMPQLLSPCAAAAEAHVP